MPFMNWPFNFPDLNSIETVWQLIKQRLAIRNPQPTRKADVEAAIKEECDNLTKNQLINIVDTMPDCCWAVIKAFGGYTAYCNLYIAT